MKIFERKCRKCGKVISSMYQKQLDYNFEAHMISCTNKKTQGESVVVKDQQQISHSKKVAFIGKNPGRRKK